MSIPNKLVLVALHVRKVNWSRCVLDLRRTLRDMVCAESMHRSPICHPCRMSKMMMMVAMSYECTEMLMVFFFFFFFSPAGRKTITGSFIGSMDETKEMLEFCEKNGLTSMIEMVKMEQINEAMERLERNDVRYRFVVDVAGSKLDP